MIYAKAYPRKHFFLEMFTRDISLEDCILDLIDNAIDALIRTHGIDTSDIGILRSRATGPLPSITIKISTKRFSIDDNCGGIPLQAARDDVFNFGADPRKADTGTLGVYGIGMKRAIFKIGNTLHMESQTTQDGFALDLDVKKWATDDEDLEDWKFPLNKTQPASSARSAGTSIVISDLRDEVALRVEDPKFASDLHRRISVTYAWFLGTRVAVTVNGTAVTAFPIPFGGSDEIQPGKESFAEDDVKVDLWATLAARRNGEWKHELAGWYVMCNGRVILAANKDDVTGWGGGPTPTFQPKFRGFLGLALFSSTNGLALPWTTTKRDLNRESRIYIQARNRMRGLARPVLTFLGGMYPSEPAESQPGRDIARGAKLLSPEVLAQAPVQGFSVRSKKRIKNTTKVQYDARIADLDLVRQHLRRPSMAAREIGEMTLGYYLKQEGLK